jgi:hypothetical protein|tara:strand:- start:737 stop:931 length:195 start_codon:yes stop_codon:yes gene_type:complete
MDIDPQAVISALSNQIGALQTENTVLKMALAQQSEALAAFDGASDDVSATDKKKSAPKGAADSE